MVKNLIIGFLLISVFPLKAAELVVISDLDETLRMANVEKKIKAGFRLLKGVKPYQGLRHVFNDLAQNNQSVRFIYLSNSYNFFYKGEHWLKKHGFPEGIVYQRNFLDSSHDFKERMLRKICSEENEPSSFLMFGDNVEKDLANYTNFARECPAHSTMIYMRDGQLNFPTGLPNVRFFQHEKQLLLDDHLFLDQTTFEKISVLKTKELIPTYLIQNLKKRLKKECRRRSEAKSFCRNQIRKELDRRLTLLDLSL
jgi:hypothetical protein